MENKTYVAQTDSKTHEALIASGIRLIAERGYERASVGDIAQQANVTKGALYYHFGSKEDFVLAIIRQNNEKNIKQFKKIEKDNISLADWIERSFSTIMGFSDSTRQRFLLQIMLVAMQRDQEAITEVIASLHEQWRVLIAEMVVLSREYRQGRVLGHPEVIAAGVMALVDGLLIHAFIEPEKFSQEAFIKRLAPLLKLWVMQNPSDD